MMGEIVRADETLREAAVAIRQRCLREVCGLGAEHVFAEAFLEETRRFLSQGDQTTLLAMDGSMPVACATLCSVRCLPTPGHPTGKRAHLMNVYTDPAYRRRGLARQLLMRLHAEAEARGVTEISLDATADGRRVYETLGYEASDEAMTLDIGR